MNDMRISIIVPAFNEERLLADSLAAIRAAADVFAGRGWQHELIVCDNNSTDYTAEIARAAGAQVVFEPVNQIARARNTGARKNDPHETQTDQPNRPCPQHRRGGWPCASWMMVQRVAGNLGLNQ